jgi:glycosyltransferase involved in cell wall biosynthesis
MELSVVVPLYNEKDNVKPLIAALNKALKDIDHEIILVNDGSTDNTVDEVLNIKQKNLILINFSRNFGQTSAMAAGIDKAAGEYIVTLDGDLQNDPADIPVMLKKIKDKDLDIVSGARANRKDNALLTNIPSKIGNALIRKLLNVKVKDYGCTLKIFKADIAKQLDLYGELHRFIPILASFIGARIESHNVKHHKRIHGQSKYNILKTFRVVSDLILMYFFAKYRQKPMHLFGTAGIFLLVIGGLIEFYLLCLKIFGYDIGSRPLFYVGILLIIISFQFFTTGFLAELNNRTYYDATNKKPYVIKDIYKNGKKTK